MPRALPIVAAILVLAALGVMLVLSFGGDEPTPIPVDGPGTGGSAAREPIGPAGDPGRPTAPTPDRTGTIPPRAPTPAPRRVLRVGWLGTRPPEYRPREREAPLEPPPFERVLKPAAKPVVRTIRVMGARPEFMVVMDGTPFGNKKFTPEPDGDGVAFRLEDPIGVRAPRIVVFLLAKHAEFVERFLPPGRGAHTFRIGTPGTITGRITDAAGKPIPGVVRTENEQAQADFNGDFTLQGIFAGEAVVYARAPVAGYMVKRCLLRSPGGPYTIRLDPGVDLKLAMKPLPEDMEPALACVVPGSGSTVPDDYAAEKHYHERIVGGAENIFFGLPRDFVGVLAFWSNRAAARLVRLAPPWTDLVRTTLTPRTVISGEVRDAETMKPIDGEIRVSTSADATTLYDLAVAKQHVPRPADPWRHPMPNLCGKLVDIDRAPKSGKAFEIHADPALGRLGVRVEADGYLPFAKHAIKLDAGSVHLVFQLTRDRPIERATVVLALPPAPPGGWGELAIEGTVKGRVDIDRRRGEVRFTDLMPGLYYFKLEGKPEVKPRQVQIEAGANLRLTFPE